MKALSLTQPWALLVVAGCKSIETRSWSTPYRGRLAIHAAKNFPARAQALCWAEPFRSILEKLLRCASPEGFDRGVVIGAVELFDVVRTDRLPVSELEQQLGDFSPGRFAWRFQQPIRFVPPIPARGALGLWDWEGGA